jgi:hypothetical protein
MMKETTDTNEREPVGVDDGISQRAFAIYVAIDGQPGTEMEDWSVYEESSGGR